MPTKSVHKNINISSSRHKWLKHEIGLRILKNLAEKKRQEIVNKLKTNNISLPLVFCYDKMLIADENSLYYRLQ